MDISTHSLTKRLTRTHSHLPTVESYFNSQPHEEADDSYIADHRSICISTHSLTKRLTINSPYLLNYAIISTHSLTKRLTAAVFIRPATKQNFNSQPHEEADGDTGNLYRHCNISTHSLTKRLTNSRGHLVGMIDISTHSLTKRLTTSQNIQGNWDKDFNSQPHEEADGMTKEEAKAMVISTHSLTKRLTTTRRYWGRLMNYFNSQPHEEADRVTKKVPNR